MNANLKNALASLDKAIAHRPRIGSELTPTSNLLLVQWYEDALEVEEAARVALRVELDEQKRAQLRDACFIAR